MTDRNGGLDDKARAARLCREALSRQLGLITRRQALDFGYTERQIDRLVKNGSWQKLHSGIYADASSPSSWRRSVLAAVLHAGPGAAASGVCAAAVQGLPGFRPGCIEVTAPRGISGVPYRTRRANIPADLVTRVGPIPVTEASRTLLDLAGDVSEQKLEVALDDALRRRLTSLPRLKWLVRTVGKGKKGSTTLRKLVMERVDNGPIPESVLETRLWKPLTKLGVPSPIKQHPIDGGRYRVDFAFPHAMVAVEAQSFTWHSSRKSWERDIDKANSLTAEGWTVIYVTWSDLRESLDATVDRLRDLLLPRFL